MPASMTASFLHIIELCEDSDLDREVFRVYLIGCPEAMSTTSKRTSHTVLGYSEFKIADCISNDISKEINVISKSISRGKISISVIQVNIGSSFEWSR